MPQLFTDRARGNLSPGVGDDPAAVARRHRRLAERAGLTGPEAIAWMSQVHGTAVAVLERAPAGPLPATDGMVTDRPGLALATLAADCVPVLALDPVARVVGAGHAGRRGAAGGLLPALLDAMVGRGARPDRIELTLGPAICGQCYEVPFDMQAEVETQLPGSAVRTRSGTAGLDLRAGLVAQAGRLGIGPPVLDPRCTSEDRNLFSHRRDAPTGRQAGLIWLTGPPAGRPVQNPTG